MNQLYELTSLFIVSFLAATILPAQSEIAIAALSLTKNNNPILLLITATTGNVLGALVNWFLGKHLMHFKNKKWFPIKEKMINKSATIYNKWGKWSLLFAWLPIIGDPLTLTAGIFKVNIWIFIILVTLGKASRYIFILWII